MQKKLTNTIELCEYREGEGGYVEKILVGKKYISIIMSIKLNIVTFY